MDSTPRIQGFESRLYVAAAARHLMNGYTRDLKVVDSLHLALWPTLLPFSGGLFGDSEGEAAVLGGAAHGGVAGFADEALDLLDGHGEGAAGGGDDVLLHHPGGEVVLYQELR